MRIIYSRVTGVIAWIGKSSDDSSLAIAALKRMPATTSSSARDTIWEGLESLFARPYWKRIWIIQENVVVAKISFVALTPLPGVKWKLQTKGARQKPTTHTSKPFQTSGGNPIIKSRWAF